MLITRAVAPAQSLSRHQATRSAAALLLTTGLMLALTAPGARGQADPVGGNPMADAGGGITAIEEAILGPSRTPAARPKSPDEPAKTPEQIAKDLEAESRLHLSFGLDWSNMYIGRGFMQESGGFILQPSAVISYDIIKNDDIILTANFGAWSSFQDRRTGSQVQDSFRATWYESDYTAGLSATLGDFTIGIGYGWYGSPNDAFTQTQEVLIAASYDDSKLLGAFSLKPNILIAIETADGTSDGLDRGSFFQFGVSPGIDLPVTESWQPRIELPVAVGLSLGNYYQEPVTRNDETFGFVSVGPKLSVPLPFGDGFGNWKLNAAATWWFLGNHAGQFNNNDKTEFQVTVGLAVTF